MAEKKITHVTDVDWEAEVEQAEGLVLVDFWAPWCGPCHMIAPTVEAISQEYEGKVKVVKLNVDESPQTAAAYGIRSIPTVALFQDGEPAWGIVGVVPKQTITEEIEARLTPA